MADILQHSHNEASRRFRHNQEESILLEEIAKENLRQKQNQDGDLGRGHQGQQDSLVFKFCNVPCSKMRTAVDFFVGPIIGDTWSQPSLKVL